MVITCHLPKVLLHLIIISYKLRSLDCGGKICVLLIKRVFAALFLSCGFLCFTSGTDIFVVFRFCYSFIISFQTDRLSLLHSCLFCFASFPNKFFVVGSCSIPTTFSLSLSLCPSQTDSYCCTLIFLPLP